MDQIGERAARRLRATLDRNTTALIVSRADEREWGVSLDGAVT